MKILLVGINSKYIHSNPALYYLRSYAEKYASDAEMIRKVLEIREYTINQEAFDIISDIFETGAEVVCFSCYIWNISMVEKVIRTLGKVMQDTDFWLGGPEVSFDSEKVFGKLPEIRGIMAGEGEKVFLELCESYCGGRQRKLARVLKAEKWLELDDVPFPYGGAGCHGKTAETGIADGMMNAGIADRTLETGIADGMLDAESFKNRIIYYESSRGCPYGCSYCLSSVDRHVRLRSMSLVEMELQTFLDAKVPQVKFVDRTFNCNREHTRGILEYLKKHDNGVTNFHFEIAAEALNTGEIELLSTLRPGQVQLEIGVQTTNRKTLEAINRKSDIEKLSTVVERLVSSNNMHIHLDLIAGLPFEDIRSFRHSFNRIFAMHGDNLQLGFLKVLKGSPMADKQEEYGLVYSAEPPYEILSTKWLSYPDVLELKRVEEMLEVYNNSLQFRNTLKFIEDRTEFEKTDWKKNVDYSDREKAEKSFTAGEEDRWRDMYSVFLDMAEYYRRHGIERICHSRNERYRILRDWWLEKHPEDEQILTELLLTDMYLRENVKSRPDYGQNGLIDREEYREFFESGEYKKYLQGYETYSSAQVSRMVHIEKTLKGWLLFDYLHRKPITKDADTIIIKMK